MLVNVKMHVALSRKRIGNQATLHSFFTKKPAADKSPRGAKREEDEKVGSEAPEKKQKMQNL